MTNKKKHCKNCQSWKKPFYDSYQKEWGECKENKKELFTMANKSCKECNPKK